MGGGDTFMGGIQPVGEELLQGGFVLPHDRNGERGDAGAVFGGEFYIVFFGGDEGGLALGGMVDQAAELEAGIRVVVGEGIAAQEFHPGAFAHGEEFFGPGEAGEGDDGFAFEGVPQRGRFEQGAEDGLDLRQVHA